MALRSAGAGDAARCAVMTLRIHTARLAYRGPDRLDITRAGADAARRKGEPFPGEPWAPSWGILKPALDARKEAIARRVVALQEVDLQAVQALADEADRIEADAWAAYVPAYTAEMRASYSRHRAAWDALLAREEVTLCCYCAAPPGGVLCCHRRLLAAMLAKCGAADEGEREP